MKKNEDMLFQILDWNYYHEETNEDNEEEKIGKDYVIRLFGRTDDNKSIYVKVTNYTPYFYIEIDEKWRNDMVDKLIDHTKSQVNIKNEDEKWVNCGNGLIKYQIEKKYKFRGFTNFKKFTFVKLIFRDFDSMRGWTNYFRRKRIVPGVSKTAIKFPLYESNIEPYLRCMHIKDLEAVGWVKILKKNFVELAKDETCCDINISTSWTNLEKVNSRTIQQFVIAAFDIECKSGDGSFPQAERDADGIIQIGTTFSRFGETECFYQHIITLGTCDNIEGAEVIVCKTEKQVLLEWTKMIRKMDPDIITGFNIFQFDYKYLKDRAKKLGISSQFSRLSRVTNEYTKFKTKDLTSAALGKNTMTWYDMTGRINIDLMKVVQKDYKLVSYKLDYVASYFIKEDIDKLVHKKKNNQTLIATKSIYGVKENQYITILYNDGITDNRHMEGKKFKILGFTKEKNIEKNKEGIEIQVEKDIIIVDGIIDMDIMGKICS